MIKARRFLAGLMSAAMVFSGAGITVLNSAAAVYAEEAEYDYLVSVPDPLSIPEFTWTGDFPDLNACESFAVITVYEPGSGQSGLKLTRGKDFLVEADSADAGPAKALFTCTGDYAGKTIMPVDIIIAEPETPKNYTVIFDPEGFEYDGTPLTAEEVKKHDPQVILNGNTEVTDYVIIVEPEDEEKDEGNAGEVYSVVFEADGEQAGDAFSVTIGKRDLSTVKELNGAMASEPVYDGTPKTVEFDEIRAVIDDDPEEGSEPRIVELDKWTVDPEGYENNIGASYEGSNASALIRAADDSENFTGSAEISFPISPAILTKEETVFETEEVQTLIYNGTSQYPEDIRVNAYFDADKETPIPADDIEVIFKDGGLSKDAGAYKVSIVPKSNNLVLAPELEPGDLGWETAYIIEPAELSDVSVEPADGVYPTAKADISEDLAKFFAVTLNDHELEQYTDYTVDSVVPSPALQKVGDEVTVTLGAAEDDEGGSLNFKGARTFKYTAESVKLADVYRSEAYDAVEKPYKGTQYVPNAAALGTLTAADPEGTGAASLTADQYEITGYGENIKAGYAEVMIAGKDVYAGQTAVVRFEITPAALSDVTVSGIENGKYFVGQEIAGAVVKTGDTVLDETEYRLTVAAVSETESKMTAVKVEGRNDHGGSVTVDVSDQNIISIDATLADAVIDGTVPAGLKDYKDPKYIKEYVTVTLADQEIDSSRYDVAVNGNPEGTPGTTVEITVTAAEGGLLSGSKDATLDVVKRDIAEIEEFIQITGQYVYNGEEQEAAFDMSGFEAEAADAKVPAEGEDFTVSYRDNIMPGKAAVVLTGTGSYFGEAEKEFTIEKRTLKLGGDLQYKYPDADTREFTPGRPEDHSDLFELNIVDPETGEETRIDPSEYTLALPDKPVSAGQDDDPDQRKEEVEITDRVEDQIRIIYRLAFNEDSVYQLSEDSESEVSYLLLTKTVTNAFIDPIAELPYSEEGVYELGEDTLNVRLDDSEGLLLRFGADYDAVLIPDKTPAAVGTKFTVQINFKGNYAGIRKTGAPAVTVVPNEVDLSNIRLVIPSAADLVYNGQPKVITANDIGVNKVPEGSVKVVCCKADGDGSAVDEVTDAGSYIAKAEPAEGYALSDPENAPEPVRFTVTPKRLNTKEFGALADTVMVVAEDTDEGKKARIADDKEFVLNGVSYGLCGDQMEITNDPVFSEGDITGTAEIALKSGANFASGASVSKEFRWSRSRLTAEEALALFAIDDQVYRGTALEPVPYAAAENADDSWIEVVSYSNNVNVSSRSAKAAVKISIPETAEYEAVTYSGLEMIFAIRPITLKASDTEIAGAVYTGEAVVPEVTVRGLAGDVLKEGRDYTLALENNVNAGKGLARIEGIGNYGGTVEKEFDIARYRITDPDTDMDITRPEVQFRPGPAADHSSEFVFRFNGSELEKDKDYTLELIAGQEITGAGGNVCYEFRPAEDGNFEIDGEEGLKIGCPVVPKNAEDASIILMRDTVPYSPSGNYALSDSDIRIKADGTVLVPFDEASGTGDYSAKLVPEESGRPAEPGDTLRLVVTFLGNYCGTNSEKTVTVTDNKIDLSGVRLAVPADPDLIYDGKPKEVAAADVGAVRVPDDSYTVKYYQNGSEIGEAVKAGVYTAKVAAADGYEAAGETESVEFVIAPKALTEAQFNALTGTLAVSDVTYAGSATKAPEIKAASEFMLDGVNCGYCADQFGIAGFNTNWDGDPGHKGTVSVSLKKGANFTYDGSKDLKFNWKQGTVSKEAVLAMFAIRPQTYNGRALEPSVYSLDPDANASWVEILTYENNTGVSARSAKAQVRIKVPDKAKFRPQFSLEETAAGVNTITGFITFEIRAANISNQTVSVAGAVYTGRALTPAVTVRDKDGALLDAGKDYNLTYSSNINAGTGKVTIRGIKNYAGSVVKTFTIKKAAVSVSVSPKTVTYNGNAVGSNAAVVTGLTTGKVTYKYYADAACSREISASGVRNAGSYYVKAYVSGDANSNAAVSAPALITIKKAAAAFKKVTPSTKTVKAGKSFTLKASLKKGDGRTFTYKKISGNSKIRVSSKGKVTVRSGLKPGTYKIKIDVTSKATVNYKARTLRKTIKIKVKKK